MDANGSLVQDDAPAEFAMGRPIPRCVDEALLSLYDCFVDTRKTRYLLHALGCWLMEETDPDAIPKFEEHSETVWSLLLERALKRQDQEIAKGAAPEAWTLRADLSPISGGDPLNLSAEDLSRARSWLKTDQSINLLIRVYGAEGEDTPSLAILKGLDAEPDRKTPNAVALYQPLNAGLAASVEGVLA